MKPQKMLIKMSRRSNTSIRSTASKASSRFVLFLSSSEGHILVFSNHSNQLIEWEPQLNHFYKEIPACLCHVMKSKFKAVIKELTLTYRNQSRRSRKGKSVSFRIGIYQNLFSTRLLFYSYIFATFQHFQRKHTFSRKDREDNLPVKYQFIQRIHVYLLESNHYDQHVFS